MHRRYRYQLLRRAGAAAVACILLAALVRAGAADGGRERLDPATEKADLLKVQNGHAVWLVSDLHPETRHHRVQTFTNRLYRQRIGEPQAKLVSEYVSTRGAGDIALRDDGSLLILSGHDSQFMPAAGAAVRQRLDWYNVIAFYPDGALFKDLSVRHPKQLESVYFIPFEGDRWRVDDRVQVVDRGVKNFQCDGGLRYPGEPYRFGDRMVWIVESTLHSFDLKTRERNEVKLLGVVWHPSYRVTAFDGSTVVCGIYAFDAATGMLLGEPDYRKRPKHVVSVFAVRNRIGYYYDSGNLRATDLTSTDGANVPLRKAEAIVPMVSDEGLTIWDGKEWSLVRWLEELRRP
jgi:hypothetical protein